MTSCQLGGNDAVVMPRTAGDYITAVRGVSLKVRVMWSEGRGSDSGDRGARPARAEMAAL